MYLPFRRASLTCRVRVTVAKTRRVYRARVAVSSAQQTWNICRNVHRSILMIRQEREMRRRRNDKGEGWKREKRSATRDGERSVADHRKRFWQKEIHGTPLIISYDVPIESTTSQIYLRLTCNAAITVINGLLRDALNASISEDSDTRAPRAATGSLKNSMANEFCSLITCW